MEKAISAYLPLSQADKAALWNDANTVFVFDANVLLNLYRLTAGASAQLIQDIESLGDRVWIPHHVAYAYAKKRAEVILNTLAVYDVIQAKIDAFVEKLAEVLQVKEDDASIRSMRESLAEWLGEVKSRKLHISDANNDAILQKLLEVFHQKVGEPYSDEARKNILMDAKRRLASRTPPEFYVAVKGQEDTFEEHDYGNVILWKQIIDYARVKQKNVILVTDDRNEAWWQVIHGKTIGPKPELIEEFNKYSGSKFYMFTVEAFIARFVESFGNAADVELLKELCEQKDADCRDLLGMHGVELMRAFGKDCRDPLVPDLGEPIAQMGELQHVM